jgi:hypothetical protein
MANSRTHLSAPSPDAPFIDVIDGIPWDLAKIIHGTFHRNQGTNGFVSIDSDRWRVYVFQ